MECERERKLFSTQQIKLRDLCLRIFIRILSTENNLKNLINNLFLFF